MVKPWQENRDIYEHISGPISPTIRHEMMQAEIDALRADRIDALEAQVSALEKDAGRYQWLRPKFQSDWNFNNKPSHGRELMSSYGTVGVDLVPTYGAIGTNRPKLSGQTIDAAIDAAIASQKATSNFKDRNDARN